MAKSARQYERRTRWAHGSSIRRWLAHSLGLLLAVLAAPAAARDLSFDHFIHTKLEAKEGLPVQANSIVQTPDGYLWFGTPDGLYRYNGQSFEHMPVERRNGFTDAAIIEAIVTKRGELWLGLGQNSGVAVLRGGIVRQTNMPHPPPQVTHLLERTDGVIWAASSGKTKRLFRYVGGGWQQMDEVMAMPIGAVADLECDRQGTIWVSLAGPTGSTLAYLRAGSDRFETATTASDWVGSPSIPKAGCGSPTISGPGFCVISSGHPPVRPDRLPAHATCRFPAYQVSTGTAMSGVRLLSGGMFLIPDAANVGNSGELPLTFGRTDRIGMVATLDVFLTGKAIFGSRARSPCIGFHPANAVPVTGIDSNPSGPQRLAVATDESVYLFSLGSSVPDTTPTPRRAAWRQPWATRVSCAPRGRVASGSSSAARLFVRRPRAANTARPRARRKSDPL